MYADLGTRTGVVPIARIGDTGVMAEAVRTLIGPDPRLPKRRTLDERMMCHWPVHGPPSLG